MTSTKLLPRWIHVPVTAPLTVVFVRESFGLKNLGALAGLPVTRIRTLALMGAGLLSALAGFLVYGLIVAVLMLVAGAASGATVALHAPPR